MQQIGTAYIANSFHPNYATQHNIYSIKGSPIALDSNMNLTQNPDGTYNVTQRLTPEQLAHLYHCKPGQIGTFQAIA